MTPLGGDFDEDAMAEAEAALKALADEYPLYAAADVDQMDIEFSELEAAGGLDTARIEALFGVAHNVKGQGSAFGYDLMTVIGEALCVLLRGQTALDQGAMASVKSLISACRTVLTERLVGHGGVYGERLSANLGLALEAA